MNTFRANSGHPAPPKSPMFPAGDKRRDLVMSVLDHRKVPRSAFEIGAKTRTLILFQRHRIHFALNCGARSCPPIRVYAAAKLEAQLNTAAKAFCSQEVSHTQQSNFLLKGCKKRKACGRSRNSRNRLGKDIFSSE